MPPPPASPPELLLLPSGFWFVILIFSIMCWLLYLLRRMLSPSPKSFATHTALHEPLLMPREQQMAAQSATALPRDINATHMPPAWHNVDARARQVMARAEARLARSSIGPPLDGASGNYVGLYWQYGRAHPIPAQSLACTPTEAVVGTSSGTVMGSGNDVPLAGVRTHEPDIKVAQCRKTQSHPLDSHLLGRTLARSRWLVRGRSRVCRSRSATLQAPETLVRTRGTASSCG